MFADLAFLWRSRERPTTFRRWLRVYAKRALHALALIRLLMRAAVFRLRGAEVGRFVVFGRCRIDDRRGRRRARGRSSVCSGRQESGCDPRQRSSTRVEYSQALFVPAIEAWVGY